MTRDLLFAATVTTSRNASRLSIRPRLHGGRRVGWWGGLLAGPAGCSMGGSPGQVCNSQWRKHRVQSTTVDEVLCKSLAGVPTHYVGSSVEERVDECSKR